MLTPAEVRTRHQEIEQENKDGWEKLLKEFSPEHPHSPFHRFCDRIISGPRKTQLRNLWLSLVHPLEATIEKRWREFDGWRGCRAPNRQTEARQFIKARLALAEPWFEKLIAKHNAQVSNALASKAQATSPPLATSGQGAPTPAAAEQGEGGTPPADPFAELRQYACDNLKGIERAVIEALCDVGGKLLITALAVKNGIDWDNAVSGFTNAQRRLKRKLKKQGWKLARRENFACLVRIKAHLKTVQKDGN